jgi:hypothetical protein
LKESFIKEFFPVGEGRSTPVEDKVVPLLPDGPGCYDEELHEEVMGSVF